MALLTVAGGLAGRKCALELKPGWVQHPCLYVALVAESGSGKSPAFDLVLAPVQQADEALYEQYQEARKAYHREMKDFKAGKREAEPQRPVARQLLIDDCTGESLGPILRDNPNGVVLALDELSVWVSSMNMYRGGRGRDRQLFLSVWSGRPFRVDRKTAEGQGHGPILVKTPFVAVVGCIPPSQVGKLRGHESDEGDGLVERVLFVQPPRRPLPRRLFDP